MLFRAEALTMALLIAHSFMTPIHTLPSGPLMVRGESTETKAAITSTLKTKEKALPSQDSATSTMKRQQNSYEGDGTFYSPGMGACGHESKSSDFIVAVSHDLYDRHQEGDGGSNDLCGRNIQVNYGSKSITVAVVDRCEGCGPNDLDFSPAAFKRLSSPKTGRLHDIQWVFV